MYALPFACLSLLFSFLSASVNSQLPSAFFLSISSSALDAYSVPKSIPAKPVALAKQQTFLTSGPIQFLFL